MSNKKRYKCLCQIEETQGIEERKTLYPVLWFIPLVLLLALLCTVPVSAAPHVECYTEESLTTEALRSRKKDHALVIEEVSGRVLNSARDGKTSCGKYISYKRVAGARKKNLITTFCFYDPTDNYIDSINLRMDFINIVPEVKIVNYATKAMRTQRKDRYILIERVVGEVKTVDKKGRDTAGRIIDYRKVPNAKVGDVIVSYRVYANNNETTSVARRYDFIWR